MDALLAFVAFAVLLLLEWWRRWRSVRAAATGLAVILLFFSQPLPRRAARYAIGLPADQRITSLAPGRALSEYASGVVTMEQAVADDIQGHAVFRWLGVGVLVWLSLSPAFHAAARGASGGSA